MRPHWSAYLAIGLLSGAIMLFELALLRIFSFAIWHHFAFMVISIALLGFAIGGIALQLWPALGQPAEQRAARYSILFAAASAAAVLVIALVPFDPTRIATDPTQIAFLLILYSALAVPFAFGGLAVVCLIGAYPARVDRLYGSDLAGAALGCLAVGPVLGEVGAGGAVLLAGAGAGFAAWLLNLKPELRRSHGGAPWLLYAAIFALAVPQGEQLLSVPPGKAKGLSAWLDPTEFPHARIVSTKWSALARVDVVEGSGTISWTANPVARIPLPRQTVIVLDGDAATPIVNYAGDPADLEFLDYTLSSAAYQAFHPRSALIIGAGGGVDVLTALHHGVSEIDAVELNPDIINLVTGPYAAATGHLFARPEVTLHVDEGRSFVRRQEKLWDVIQLSLIDTWAASASGAYSLSEGYLYTVEAFDDYLARLSDNGVVAITRWRWRPPRETLKLATVASAALERRGVENPRAHVVVLGLGDMGSILIKRSPFTPHELAEVDRIAKERSFVVLYAPGRAGGGAYANFFGASDPEEFLADYVYDVSPAFDDSPFFFNFGRWPDAESLISGWRESLLVLSGRLVLVAVLVQATVLSIVLLVLPMVWRRNPRSRADPEPSDTSATSDTPVGRGAGAAVLYFALIGLCFMLIEIVLMQRFTLFLGHPLYAVAFVLAVLLAAAGLGSMASHRLLAAPRFVFASIALLSVAYAFGLPAVFQSALGFSLAARLFLGVLLIFPLGFLLGFPFPAGLARLVQSESDGNGGRAATLGWAWAANGCASVVGPIGASLLAIDFGFAAVMVLAALGYACAYAVFSGAGSARAR